MKEKETYRKKFKCASDPKENFKLWGNYNTAKGSMLRIVFRKCEGHDYCKSEAEIKDWIIDKYIVLLYN